MSRHCLQLKPHTIDDDTWWYEEARGILVYVRSEDKQGRPASFLIPVGQIRQYLKRLDAKPNPRIKKKKREVQRG